jgi:lipopolysaccharide O-acetyltransferase
MTTSLRTAREFINENGWLLFVDELTHRLLRIARGKFLYSRLRAEGLRVGPQSCIRGLAHIRMGRNFHAGRGLWLDAVTRYHNQRFSPQIIVGDSVFMSDWVHVSATSRVEIGDHCLFGSKVFVSDHTHGSYSAVADSPAIPPPDRPLGIGSYVVIRNRVFLGDGVVVLPGVTIGSGSIIGANSVVSRDIPANVIAVGAPAKPVKEYNLGKGIWQRIDL